MTAQVILIETSPRRVVDGLAETVRLAGGGAQVPFAYAGQNDWRAGITSLPTLIASLEYQGGEFPPGSVPAAAEIEWGPSSTAALAALASYMWFDAPISVWIGPEGALLPPLALSGRVLEAPAADGKLKISLADPATALMKPLLTTRFLGTGGLEGPVEWQGLIKPRIWGRVWNLSGQPIDKANNVYMFADPQRQIQAITAVRDKGAPAAALTTLAWQGSVAATFAALQAAAAPAGGGVICPSIACIKWWTQPAGALCADLKGEIGAGYVETTATIMQRLVDAINGPVFAAGTIAAADAVRAAPVGWIANDDSTTVAAMLDELAGNSSLIWLLDTSQTIVLRTWTWGASAAAAISQSVSRRKVLRPVATRKLGYQRNETRMQRGDLAAIVLASEARYSDGTPIEQLEPAEAGANVTGTHTAASIMGQGTGATANNLAGLNATEGAKLGGIAKGATAADNLVLNGDFTDGLTNWSGSPQVTVVAGAAGDPGRFKARVTGALGTFSTSANQAYSLPVYGGSRVWISGWIRTAGDPAQDYGYLGFYFIDRENNYLGGGTDPLGTYYNNTSAWVFVVKSSIAPANATGLVVSPGFVLASSIAAVVEITGIRAAYTAPGATLGASAGTDLYRTDRTTVMTQSEVRTIEGASASIIGQAPTATDSSFAVVTGPTKPADNAGTSLTLIGIGTTIPVIRGNSIKRTSGSNFDCGAVSIVPLRGTAFVSAEISTVNTHTMVVLDDDLTTYTRDGAGSAVAYFQYNRGTGNWIFYRQAVGGVAAGSIASGLTGTVSLVYDGLTFDVYVNSTVISSDPAPANQVLYAKWFLYDEGAQLTGLQAGFATDRAWSNLGGPGKPANNATVGATAGTDLYRTGGNVVMMQVEVRTIEGTASSITGQAAAATDSTIQAGATNDRIDATRTTDTDTPLWYATNRSGKVVREAKTQGYYFSAANVPNTGNYGTLTTAVPTLYASGGAIHQWFEADNATRWHRSSASDTTWTGWSQLFSDANKPDFGGDLLETAGGPAAMLVNFKTGLGTAAGFTGQGAFATVSSVGYGSSFLTGFGAMAARVKVSLGDGFMFKADGTTGLTDALAVTSLGTAAAIVGQAVTATSSDFAGLTGGTKPENNADVTILVTGSKSVNVAYDYLGAVKTGELPVDVVFKLMSAAGTDVTTSASWAGVLKSGTATFTPTVGVPNTTGVLNVTVLSADAVIEMQATYSGKVRSGSATLLKKLDPPPVGGSSGGSASSTSTISQTTAATYGAANTAVLTATAGAGGQVSCSFPDNFKRTANGTGDCYGKWQWRVVGGTFADITTEIASTLSSNKTGSPEFANDPGSLSVAMTKTGLTNGTSYEFLLFLRSAGVYTLNHVGTASVTGS